MRTALLLASFLLWTQAADLRGTGGNAVTHLHFERAIHLPPGAAGQTCTVLDAQTFADMASRSGDDLRVFRNVGADTGANSAEVPFALTESGAEPGDAQPATLENVSAHGDTLAFDLAMPQQAYTAVELQIAANNFVAEATVTGSDAPGGPRKAMGSFTLFDLTREHLARSTELPLAESHLPLLHVSLRMYGVAPTPATIAGATVPPSREAQTLYTVVASTTNLQFKDKGWRTVAELDVPEHVPVEGARIVLDPAWQGDFLRSVAIQGEARGSARETVEGEIWRVTRPASADGPPAIEASKLAIDSVLAINLRGPATIAVSIKNGTGQPLPVRSISLEMRQRMVCFDATPNVHYTLRYGDAALHPPVYTDAALVIAASAPLMATLGPETANPTYAPTPVPWQFAESRPQMLWVGLLAMATLGGSLALHRVRHERKKG